jgi:hypothetical protein
MVIDWSEVSSIATVIYGGATLLLVIQIWRDRVQRDRHFEAEAVGRKLDELRTSFFDACGYWLGHVHRGGNSIVDAAQAGKVFEALTRLEGQLRLNGYVSESQNLGRTVRTNILGVDDHLEKIGVVLGLRATEYSQARAVGQSGS